LPVSVDKIEPVAEPIPIMKKMKRHKFYSFSELYKMTFGKKPLKDILMFAKEKKLWMYYIRRAQLQTTLDLLVLQDRLKIGKKVNETPETIDVEGEKVTIDITLRYALWEKTAK
jgi:hypothetical protein